MNRGFASSRFAGSRSLQYTRTRVSAPGLLLVFTAALIGGAVNSIAGGGTLLTFPAIVWLGVPPIAANATSTVALWPGSFGSMWAYRGELDGARALADAGSRSRASPAASSAPSCCCTRRPIASTRSCRSWCLARRCCSCCSSRSAAGWRAAPPRNTPPRAAAAVAVAARGTVRRRGLRRLLRRRHRHPDAGDARRDGPDQHPSHERPEELGRDVHQRDRRPHFVFSGIVNWPVAARWPPAAWPAATAARGSRCASVRSGCGARSSRLGCWRSRG